MAEAEAVAVLTPTGAWLARPRPALTEKAAHDLDSSRLDVALAGLPPHQLVYQHGWDHAAAAVATRQADAAVLLRPATVDQIEAVSRGQRRMPAKTTFFWPKPRTGSGSPGTVGLGQLLAPYLSCPGRGRRPVIPGQRAPTGKKLR